MNFALVFLESGEGKNSLLDMSKSVIDVQFDMSRKVDKVSRVKASLKITKSNPISVTFEGEKAVLAGEVTKANRMKIMQMQL